MANKKGTGRFMVWVDVPADKEAEFNGYYNEEHLAELLAVPGVLNAARYEAVSSGPKHLACYELESPAVIETDAFKNRQPTERNLRAGPRGVEARIIRRRKVLDSHLPLFQRPVYLPHAHHQPLAISESSYLGSFTNLLHASAHFTLALV